MARFFLIAFLTSSVLAWSPAARADLVSIGLQEPGVNGDQITTVAASSGAAGSLTMDYGSFVVSGSLAKASVGAGALSELLDSATIDASASSPGTLHIWITAQGLASPAGLADVISSLALDVVKGDVQSVTEETFYSATDGRYGTTTPLSSASFTEAGSATDVAPVDFTGGLFSITEEYTIVLIGPGLAAGTIDTSDPSVPEPGSLLLLGTALLGFGMVVTKRKRA